MKTTPHICTDSAQRDEHQGSMEHCDCCGRPIKGTPRFWIECVNDGTDVAEADGKEHEGSLGFYPIGPECAKKYGFEFISDTAGG